MAVATAVLAACGGGSDDDSGATMRLVNATLTHASLNLLANSETVVTGTALDTASAYAGIPDGSPSLQVNDATTGGVLAVSAPTITGGQKAALLAYESGGSVRTAVIAEDTAQPASGTAILRVFNAATDAGSVDVYITDPAVDITTLASPTFTFIASSSVQASNFVSFGPGTYRVRVTGAGNTSDLRLDIPAVVLANQQVGTVILTPTAGGTLANGSVLIQDADYTASRNTSARVRLFAAVSNGASVSATAGTTPIATSVVAPVVGPYANVPSGSALAITVNGASVAAPATPLAAGSDSTLMVYGSAASPTATLIADDNHLPAASSNYKLRLVNGLTGAAPPLSMDVNFIPVATSVAPGSASPYTVLTATPLTATQISVTSPNSPTPILTTAPSLQGSAVYTLFMLGDAAASPAGAQLRRDR
jgi:hypothetical protein